MSDSTEEKGLILFGRDISKVPCFRNSYLYGISSGLAAGLAFFMFTSRTSTSCHVGMASFAVVTLSYWVQCRYKYSQTKFEMLRLQELLKHNTTFEGTATEVELDKRLKTEGKDA